MIEQFYCSLFTICGDACPLSCVSAEACLTGWPNARDNFTVLDVVLFLDKCIRVFSLVNVGHIS